MTSAEAETPSPIDIAPPAPAFPLFERIAGASWFLFVCWIYSLPFPALIARIESGAGAQAWVPLLSRGCTLLFFATMGVLMLTRPPAVAGRRGLAPLLISMTGTYGVWLMALLPPAHLPAGLQLAAAAITLVGSVLIIAVILKLGNAFSIAPQARSLVTTGPYRFIRHPLYAVEEIAIVGALMSYVWWAAAPFLLAHIALQVTRMRYEEKVLTSVFPDYPAYAARTARIIPGVW